MPPNKPMTKKKVFFLIAILLLGLAGLRIGWMLYYQIPDHPHAEKGIIDLRDWEFTDQQPITLDKEWEFYPNHFIDPLSTARNEQKTQAQSISVPGNWGNEVNDGENGKNRAFGYGTYRLTMLLPNKTESMYGLRLENVTTAAQIYINGHLISSL